MKKTLQAFILAIKHGFIEPFKIIRQCHRLAHPNILKNRSAQIHHNRLHRYGVVIGDLRFGDHACFDGRKVITRCPCPRFVFGTEKIFAGFKAFKCHFGVLIIHILNLVKIIPTDIHHHACVRFGAPIIGVTHISNSASCIDCADFIRATAHQWRQSDFIKIAINRFF